MTLWQALAMGTAALEATSGESARFEARQLLAHGMGLARLPLSLDASLSPAQEAAYRESLERRLALLESRPVQAPDAAGIVQDVLALVRVDMEKASEEQEASARALEQLERRVQELESRPLPQLILPDLPDTEAITADVMSRIQNELDRIAAEAAARVLREEIAGLMGK